MIFWFSGELLINSWKTSSRFNKKNAVKCRISKFNLFKQLVRYLGLIVSTEGYVVDPNDDAVLETIGKTSETVRESQLLLAFLRQYQSYKKKFLVILKSVNNVLKVKSNLLEKKSPRYKRKQKRLSELGLSFYI